MFDEGDNLSAAQRGSVRRRSQPKERGHDSEGGELNVVPFLDIITNVMMFVLAALALTFTVVIEAKPPRFSRPRPPTEGPPLALNIVVLHDGFLVSAMGQRIGTGCNGVGAGLAVERTNDGAYDFAALTRCVKRLKATSASFADEKQATIAANDDIRYQVIVDTIDAVRRTDGVDLFPEVFFGVPR